MYLYEKVIVSH